MPIWRNAKQACQVQIEGDKTFIYLQRFGILIGILIALYILFRIGKVLLIFTKRKIANGKEKIGELKKERAHKRIRDIAEEESIRANVKKTIDDSEDDELEDLQNLINKAVAKGDSETAKALLKILNKKKK